MLKRKPSTQDSSKAGVCVCACVHQICGDGEVERVLLKHLQRARLLTQASSSQTLFGECMSTAPELERMCRLSYIDLLAAQSTTILLKLQDVLGCEGGGPGGGYTRVLSG